MLEFFIGSAWAQAASPSPAQALAGFTLPELLALVIAGVAFFFVARLFARWPKAELWLVAAAFTGLAPLIILVLWIDTGGAFDRYNTPNRIYLGLFAVPLLWWVLRTKSSLLGLGVVKENHCSFLNQLLVTFANSQIQSHPV
jgi:hypothetical protein